jgi:hypothetical protein
VNDYIQKRRGYLLYLDLSSRLQLYIKLYYLYTSVDQLIKLISWFCYYLRYPVPLVSLIEILVIIFKSIETRSLYIYKNSARPKYTCSNIILYYLTKVVMKID